MARGKLGTCISCGKMTSFETGHFFANLFVICHKCRPNMVRLELIMRTPEGEKRIPIER